jgi:hypothetical protein
MSDARGYSYALVKAINAADPKLLGVRLGRVCVANDVPVSTIATRCGVSRQAVYWWFTGVFTPKPSFTDTLTEILKEYEKDRV